MLEAIKKLIRADRQIKYFILMALIYMVALIWTTLQSYARLEYSRSDRPETTAIQEPGKSNE